VEAIARVQAYLQARDPGLQIIIFQQDTSTAVLAARALGTEVGQIAKSILFKTKNDEYFMVVAAGDTRIDSKAIRRLAGCKARMATAEEVTEVTGFNVGGVCPFALRTEIPVFLDESLKGYDIVYAAAGGSNTALPISYGQLCSITGGQPCDVAQRG